MAGEPIQTQGIPPAAASTTDAKTMVKNLLIGSIRPLFFVLLGLVVFWFLFNQIGDSRTSILSQLNEPAAARGLITFVVATSTVAAAMMLLLAAIISEGSESDVKMRISEGRQVVAPLIGILGTIVGFYFGQTATNTAQAPDGPQQTLRVAAVTVAPEQVAAGSDVTVTSSVSGGLPPYAYTITLPGIGQPVRGKIAQPGEIKKRFPILAGTKPQDVTIQLEGRTSPVRRQRRTPIDLSK